MSIRAVFFDLGGVIVRTTRREPRTRLAESLGMSYAGIEKVVFENESSLQASLGVITETQHWQSVTNSLKLPQTELERIRDEFFAGDTVDLELIALIRSLRPAIKTGVISNAWSGLRTWIISQDFADAFDNMVISAENGWVKPDARIYQLAMQNLKVLPQESVFLDDMLRNVEAARKLGMHAIQFIQPEAAIAELKALLAG
jgi:putative hydrolase of the HAD superfamily